MGRTIKAQATCTVGICKFQTISGASFSSFAIPEKCFLWLCFSEKSKVRKPTPKYKFYGGRNLLGVVCNYERGSISADCLGIRGGERSRLGLSITCALFCGTPENSTELLPRCKSKLLSCHHTRSCCGFIAQVPGVSGGHSAFLHECPPHAPKPHSPTEEGLSIMNSQVCSTEHRKNMINRVTQPRL